MRLSGLALPIAAALLVSTGAGFAADAMSSDKMSSDTMSSGAMTAAKPNAMQSGGMAPAKPEAMQPGGMMAGESTMGGSAMSPDLMSNDMMMASGATPMGSAMMSKGKAIRITITDLISGQPFSPSYVESRTAASAPLFKLGDKASDDLVLVAEGGNIGMYSVDAAMNKDSVIGDAELAIHTLPGQTRTLTVHVDREHPLIDGVWMLGNTNDGFSGFTGIDGEKLSKPMTIEVRGYDAGSEKNNEKKGYMPALGAGNMRDPENGVITYHTGIRGDADAPKSWNWDVSKPVARVTFTPLG